MTAQQLKNSILQMAVQGKLVPQDPNDEPASVLLERIRAEKEKLIKEGKIKKEKNPSVIFRGEDNLPYEKVGNKEPVCIADEVPFEIPESWKWVRLINICTKLVDGDHNPPKGELHETKYIMVSSTNINDDTLVDLNKVRYLSKEVFVKENERTDAQKGDIFFTSVGSLGRSCIFDGSINICFQRSVSVLTTLIYNEYLKYFFDCGYYQQKISKEATGTAQKGFYLNQLAASLIPVPPLEEQKRIVMAVKEYIPHIREYDIKKRALDSLNNSFPELLKKSILQQAVMGKLVPQDENDESASALLERIRAEKDALIKAGKLKKDKHESIIYRRDNSHYEKLNGIERCIDDEIPFEVPENWTWCRLGSILYKLTDGTHKTPKYVDSGVPFLSVKDISSGKLSFDNCKFISESQHAELYERCNPEKGDILLTKVGTTGIPAIVDTDIEFSLFVSVALLKFNKTLLDTEYLIYLINSPLVQSQAIENTKGVGNKNWVMRDIANTLIAIPPIQEQHRIVDTIKIATKPLSNL